MKNNPPVSVLSSALSGLSSAVRPSSSLICRPPSVICRLASAFTLVELLVVIVVISILAGITIPVSKYAVYRAKAARQQVMLAKIRGALDDYRATYGEYPITPILITNGTSTEARNHDEAIRHYPDAYRTECYYTSNSPYRKVWLTTSGTVETIVKSKVDYGLTYPLMLKQTDKGARAFYAFPEITVGSIVYNTWDGNTKAITVRKKGGAVASVNVIYGAQVNRPTAIDPVSLKQWKYECYDGASYTITTNDF